MFEIMRRPREFTTPMREVMTSISGDPFFQWSMTPFFQEEGTLPLDIEENDNELVVRASLPGFKKDDVRVQIENGVLSITANRSEETEQSSGKFYRRERSFGSVSRRVALPGVLDDTEAEAELKDGELILHIPKSKKTKPRLVNIR